MISSSAILMLLWREAAYHQSSCTLYHTQGGYVKVI